MNIITNSWNYVPPTHVSIGGIKFKGIFTKPNGSQGCINSNCSYLASAINRTIFDATCCSPWVPEDITILRIDIQDESGDYLIEYATDNYWKSCKLTDVFG